MTRAPAGEYLITPFEFGEDVPWRRLPSVAGDLAKATVLARFLRFGMWGRNADEAAIFPHVMAQDIERAFKAIDGDNLYFVLTVGDDQLEAERVRRRRSVEAQVEASARETFRVSPQECFERNEREHLA